MKRLGLTSLVAATILFAPATAAAGDDDGGVASAMPDVTGIIVALAMEPLVPDLRVEFGPGVEGSADAVLSWPVYLVHLGLHRHLVASPFAEPQHAWASGEWRLLTGARLWWLPLDEHGLLLDAAARFGQDSDTGASLGGGVILLGNTRLLPSMPAVSVVYRYSTFGDQHRHDVSLDVSCFAVLQLLDLL